MTDANSNDAGGDDAEKMRLAFEAFMLTGKKPAAEEKGDEGSSMATSQSTSSKSKKKKKKSKKSLSGAGTPPKPTTPAKPKPSSSTPKSQTLEQSPMAKSDKKRYYQRLRSFNDKVKHTWHDIDDQMLDVLKNIVSIRGRLPLEWKILQTSNLTNGSPESDSRAGDDEEDKWKYHGFVGKPREVSYSFHLHAEDVQLALSNDLTQHEKMLAGLRTLISDLAECHDALGRMVNTLWEFHLECNDGLEEWGDGPTQHGDDMERIVQNVTNVYQMLSMELYRKQGMVPLVIESTEDEILGIQEEKVGASDGGKGSGLQTARKCCKIWQRGSEESCVDDKLIASLFKLGDTTTQTAQLTR